jgi:hypothetical protein
MVAASDVPNEAGIMRIRSDRLRQIEGDGKEGELRVVFIHRAAPGVVSPFALLRSNEVA